MLQAFSQVSKSVISPSINLKLSLFNIEDILFLNPVDKLSNPITYAPLLTKYSERLLPIKPAAQLLISFAYLNSLFKKFINSKFT